jgi:hypothetical protein
MLKNYDKIKNCPLIIVRPHPSEDLAAWKNVSKNLKNIKVIYEGEITPWINASSGLIHRGCTSAIQAYLRGLPIGYLVSKNSRIDETPYYLSKHLLNFDQIIKFCKTSINKKPKNFIRTNNKFKQMIHLDKKKLASEKIVDDLLKLEVNKAVAYRVNFREKIINLLEILYLSIKSHIVNYIYNFIGVKANEGIMPSSKKIPGGLNKKEAMNFFNSIRNSESFVIKQVIRDCIMLEKKS